MGRGKREIKKHGDKGGIEKKMEGTGTNRNYGKENKRLNKRRTKNNNIDKNTEKRRWLKGVNKMKNKKQENKVN